MVSSPGVRAAAHAGTAAVSFAARLSTAVIVAEGVVMLGLSAAARGALGGVGIVGGPVVRAGIAAGVVRRVVSAGGASVAAERFIRRAGMSVSRPWRAMWSPVTNMK